MLVIIRGLPGSGKSTKAEEYKNYLIYESDIYLQDLNGNYRFSTELHQKAKELCFMQVDFALSRGEDVVVTGVFETHASYRKFVELAKYHEVSCDVISCTEEYGDVHNVPYTTRMEMKKRWEN